MPHLFQKVKVKYNNWKNKIIAECSEEDEEIEKVLGSGWDRMGYHRPIAGYLYTFGLLIPQALFGFLILPLMQYTRYRFPEITSFEVAAGALFGALYTILDLELKPMVDRFVPQYIVTDPRTAMQYVTFFIKYQMWSGLAQILFVAIFMFAYIIPYTSFSYLTWFILFINIKQYPAILSTFQSVIGSLQHLNKENLIVFYRASILEPLTQIGGGLLGIYWGQHNPIFGEMYGLALGWAVGGYVDDFFTFGLGMYWLSKILDKYGIRMWEIYGQKVPPRVWKSGLGYAMRLWPKMIFTAAMGFSNFMITYQGLPGYLTYQGLFREAQNLKKFVGWSDDILNKSQPSFSEAFNNGKIILTKYYIAQGLRYNSFFFMILGSFNIFCLPLILEVAFEAGFLPESWRLIGPMTAILVMTWAWTPYDDVSVKMIYLSGHPEINAAVDIMKSVMDLFFSWLFLWRLQLGWVGLVIINIPSSLTGFIIRWFYMNKKVISLDKEFWKGTAWQIFFAPVLGGLTYAAFMQVSLRIIWPILKAPFQGAAILIPAIAMLLILLLVGVFAIYIPLVSYLGFWDERSLRTFKRAVAMSGPSIWLIWPMYKMFEKFYMKSPFKERSKIPFTQQAVDELFELSLIRKENYVKYIENK